MTPIEQAIADLRAVLCDPSGKCCIAGSDGDRAVIDAALASLEAAKQEPLTDERIVRLRQRHETSWRERNGNTGIYSDTSFVKFARAVLAAAPSPGSGT